MLHDDELRVTAARARRLVAAQFPGWTGRAVTEAGADGTTNAIHRIGDDLVARFPLRGTDPGEVRRRLVAEMSAGADFASHSTVPAPEPVVLGEPGEGHPLPWSVWTWLPGDTAADRDPGASTGFARDLAGLVATLRTAHTGGRRFTGDGRGGDLRDHDDWMDTCFRSSAGLLDVPALRHWWVDHRDLPRAGDDVMTHGDLIPGNVLVRDGRLAGVLDTGGFGPADPGLELVAAWHLLDDGPRAVFRDLLGCGDVEWDRGRAWAFEQAMGLVWYYRSSAPALSRLGVRTLTRVTGRDVTPPGAGRRAAPPGRRSAAPGR
ncbi:phosphotransferase [Pseudonocardia nematodicida]|uniref:Phosphotransferase n=1 Tax=Pseudonocardia nematodicida TaxID=1206997 RepID=A0ABV1KDB7_9PSEU